MGAPLRFIPPRRQPLPSQPSIGQDSPFPQTAMLMPTLPRFLRCNRLGLKQEAEGFYGGDLGTP
jgi:hypothetical protein